MGRTTRNHEKSGSNPSLKLAVEIQSSVGRSVSHPLFQKLRSVILNFLLVCSRIQILSISPVRQFIIRLFTLPVCAMRTSVCIYELVYASAVHHSLHLEDIFTVINNIENITRVTWGKIQSFVTSW